MLYVVLLAAIAAFVVGASEFLHRAQGDHRGKIEYPLFVSVVSLLFIVLVIVRIAGKG